MTKARLCLKLAAVCLLLLWLAVTAGSAGQGQRDYHPSPKAQGGKYRIAYCETEAFANYASTLYNLVQGLAKRGWVTGVKDLPYTPGQKDTQAMWEWLATHDTGPYIEFAANGYYTYQADPGTRIAVRQAILSRLSHNSDIDIMLAMGTWPGQDLATDAHHVPTLIFSTSNAVRSGIVASDSDSGRDHVWAHMDSNRYRRQLEVFHDIFAFKRLGIVYEDTVMGRSVAALEDVNAVAQDRGFTVVWRHVDDKTRQGDPNLYVRQALAAHRELAGEVDAMYLTQYSHRSPDMLPELLQPFYDQKIPVFAQQWGNEGVNGALLSVSTMDFSGIGHFGAEVIIRTLQGEKPRNIPQVFERTPLIVLNLKAAAQIGWTVPVDIILSADDVYR